MMAAVDFTHCIVSKNNRHNRILILSEVQTTGQKIIIVLSQAQIAVFSRAQQLFLVLSEAQTIVSSPEHTQQNPGTFRLETTIFSKA